MSSRNSMRLATLLVSFGYGTLALAQDQDPVRIESQFNQTHQISVAQDGSVINLPAPPDRIVVGRKDVFSVEAVGSDIVVSPMQSGESSSLFAYVQGRRFSFRLSANGRAAAVYLIDDDPAPLTSNPRRKER
jgi:hypothetical protein